MAVGAEEITRQVQAATWEALEPGKFDQTVKSDPILELFTDNMKQGEGERVRIEVVGAELNETGWSTSRSADFDTSVSGDVLGAAFYDWSKPLVSKWRLRYQDILENRGNRTKIVDLADLYAERMVYDHKQALSGGIHSAIGSIPAGAPLSLDAIVDDTLAIGGIDPAAPGKGYWASTVLNSDAAEENIVEFLTRLHQSIVDASDKEPDYAVCGTRIYNEVRSYLYDKFGPTAISSPAQLNWEELRWGNVVLRRAHRLDTTLGDNVIFMVNRGSLVLRYLEFMQGHEPDRIEGTHDTVQTVTSVLCFGTNERRANGKAVRNYD